MKSILVCTNHRSNPAHPSCGARGANLLKHQLEAEVEKAQLGIGVKEIQCMGECEEGPAMRLLPGGPIFRRVDEKKIKEILKAAKAFIKD